MPVWSEGEKRDLLYIRCGDDKSGLSGTMYESQSFESGGNRLRLYTHPSEDLEISTSEGVVFVFSQNSVCDCDW